MPTVGALAAGGQLFEEGFAVAVLPGGDLLVAASVLSNMYGTGAQTDTLHLGPTTYTLTGPSRLMLWKLPASWL